ncbi:MAG: IucA/IucC family siderophore biosynthesis protein [Halobacteria archaeon]
MTEKLDSDEVAERFSIESFLNCYLLETGNYETVHIEESPVQREGVDEVVHSVLDGQGIEVFAPLSYRSPTHRHVFDHPLYYRGVGSSDLVPLDHLTLVSLTSKELGSGDVDTYRDVLVERATVSRRNISRFVDERRNDLDVLYGDDWSFVDGEQSLVFGHHLHPTPKSRRGADGGPALRDEHAPELGRGFRLVYAKVDKGILRQNSVFSGEIDGSGAGTVGSEAGTVGSEAVSASVEQSGREISRKPEHSGEEPVSASDWVESTLEGVEVGESEGVVPLHPYQARHLRNQPRVRSMVRDGKIEFVGEGGPVYYPTASVRTLYSPDSPFMVKASLNVEITNSVRTNKSAELERGVAVSELLDTRLGDELNRRYPGFDVVRDPAYITVDLRGGDSGDGESVDSELGDGESGFETVLRENPFRDGGERTSPVVGLCQDGFAGEGSRIVNLVRDVAERECRSTGEVVQDWYRRYLGVSVEPVLWLYLTWGIGLEAHQQNSVLSVDDEGYPERFYYRDNQGYYFPEEGRENVEEVLPGVSERADTVCPKEVSDERIRYYVVVNNAFGVVNALGVAGVADEKDLLCILREKLVEFSGVGSWGSEILDPLLGSDRIPVKANLLTRLRGMDELDAPSLDEQSAYTEVPNPLLEVEE